MNEVEYKKDQRVYVRGEESMGTILEVDNFCESAEVKLDKDDCVVSASWHQLEARWYGGPR